MKKKVFSLMMTLLLAFIGVAKADVVTIGEGTSTTYYGPFNSLWGYSFVEQIYTADEIGTAGTITSISFNMSSTSEETNSVDVFMKNVSRTQFSDNTDWEPVTASDMVFSGTVTFSPGWTTITLDTPFEYDGFSNLMIGMHEYTPGYSTRYFYYTSATNALISAHSDTADPNPYDIGSFTGTKYVQNYRVNLQMDIIPGGGASLGDRLHVKYLAGEEEIVDSLNLGTRPIGAWMEPFNFIMYSEGPTYTVNVLDFTPNEDLFVVEGVEFPFQVRHNQDVDLTMFTNGTQAGLIERQFVAITEGDRAAHVWPVVVELYAPEVPDVWELACEEATTFPFVEVPAVAHNTVLHNDYTLPFPEIPEGYDAVYKLTFAQDRMLNAEVTYGENGKVALYTEDFYGEGGPMATNNYVGPQLGGAAAAPFEAQIGNGTTTTSYCPFYTYYNYSIATALYTAAELEEAGVTTAPMGSISFYATQGTEEQQGITFWMANVADTEVPSTSPATAGMTKVFTGNCTPTVGWNEFVFNQGNFAWDGTSNIMILCQRNNGSYVYPYAYWQAHNPGFYGMGYNYNDGSAYDVENTSHTMYSTSTTRPDILMKSTGRNGNRDIVTIGDGTSSYYHYPVNMYFNYSFTEQLYTPAEIGTAGLINSISFDYAYASSFSMSNVTMYMKNVSRGTFADAYDYEPVTASDIVWNGTFAANAAGWVTINLDTPFQYDGTSNLLVAFYDPTNGYPGSSWTFRTTSTTDYMAISGYSDSSLPDPYDMSNYYGTRHLYRNNIQLDITPNGGGTPGNSPAFEGMAYGPVIENAAIEAGTYYLVASSTDPDFEVTINAQAMPCPAVEGFAFNPQPYDNEDDLEPASVTLRWQIPPYATGWRLVFGSTYYPDPTHPQTVMYPEDGSWETNLANSYTVHNLWNNTNYFWHVEFKNDGCPAGVSSPVWGFTTHLNIPANLVANDYAIFNDEQVTLSWNAIQDRTFRTYYIYRDGVKVGETNTNQINATSFVDGPLAYNMDGYTYYVTAVYDEGESAPSNTINVKVSGYSNNTGINGYAYEQDGTTGIAGALVTINGTDEFGDPHTYTATTGANGYYNIHVYAGEYTSAVATLNGYQETTTVHPLPFTVAYNAQENDVNFIMDENFDAPCAVFAEYYPDSLDPESPYVKVYWGCGFTPDAMIEDFEDFENTPYEWQNDATYPWVLTTTNPYEGQYCMKSGNQQVLSSTSTMQVTVEIPADGLMSFFGKISCEQSWDFGYFYIDGVQKGSYTGAGNWTERQFDITAGTHTFKWEYTEDYMISDNDDCFYVDYINFYKQPEPPIPGMTYDFENSSFQGWTTIDADGDGYTWVLGSAADGVYLSGGNLSGSGHNSSNDCVTSGSWTNVYNEVLYPDNYFVSPQVELGGMMKFYACAQDANYASEHFGVAVSTTSNSDPNAFTMLQEWTMTAKSVKAPARPAKNARSGRAQGEWYEYTVDLGAYSGMGYVAIRHFNCSDMFMLDVDDITIGEPGKSIASGTRSLHHYNIYRTNCYNDGPYTEENTVKLATSWPYDTVYIDVEWADLAPGVYKWGVGAVYQGNRGELTESEIAWGTPMAVNNGNLVTEKIVHAPNPDLDFRTSHGTNQNAGAVAEVLGDRATEAYCICTWGSADDPADHWTRGLINFSLGNPASYTTLNSTDFQTFGLDICTTDGYLYTNLNYVLYKIDVTTGQVVGETNINADLRDGAWDVTTNTMYALYSNMLYALDVTTGNVTTVGSMGTTMIAMACDASGQLYAIEHNSNGNAGLYRIDKNTAAATLVGYTGVSTNYAQTASFDRETGVLYWAQSDVYGDNLYTVNTTTGAATLLLAGSGEASALSIPTVGGPNPGPNPGGDNTNELAEERESETVWSNCLDKDMWFSDVDVNVLLNSADSPEGTVVSLTNLNAYEQANYPMGSVTLDESGFYAWETFRRGDYAVQVELQGYETIYDTVSIWGETHLRYVMTEIIYNFVGDVYVSRTGWAMWGGDYMPDGTNPNPNPNPNPPVPGDVAEIVLSVPTDIWGDGSGYQMLLDADATMYTQLAAVSYFDEIGSFNGFEYTIPEDADYGINPAHVVINNTVTIQVPAGTYDYAIINPDKVSTIWFAGSGGNADSKGDDMVYEAGKRYTYTLVAAGTGDGINLTVTDRRGTVVVPSSNNVNTNGVFRHSDRVLSNGGDRHFEYYKVMCTSVDGVPIYNHNTVHPFCQLSYNEPYNAPLVEGEHYLVKIACMYTTGLSEWSEPVEWVYEPCEHWGPVDFVNTDVNNQGNHLTWEFDHGYNPYPLDSVNPGPNPGPGESSFTEGFEGGLNGWNVLTVNAAGGSWIHSDANMGGYDYTVLAHGGTGFAMCYSFIDYDGAYDTDSYLYTPQKYGITNGSTLTFWADNANDSYPESFSVCVATADNPSAGDFTTVWSGSAKGNGGEKVNYRHDANRYENWRQHTVDLSAYAGQNVYIAFHDVNYDMYEIWIDDVTLTAGAKGATAFTGMMGDAYMFNINDIPMYNERVYFLANLNNDARFDVVNGEANGQFVITASEAYSDMDLEEAFNDFRAQNAAEYAMMDKVTATQTAFNLKSTLPAEFMQSLMARDYILSRENNLCELATPVCSDSTYSFPAPVGAPEAEYGPDYDCLYSQPDPAWYYFRIGESGDMDIYMYSTPALDIDFCCWGPFDDPVSPCPNGLTSDKVVSCSYSSAPTEHCIIPATAQVGEYYIMVITNYSQQACNVTFSKVGGSGDTDCGIVNTVDILGFLITQDGEYLDIVGPNVREYTDLGEFGEHEYCVRPIYPGLANMPEENYYFSMGCPVCEFSNGGDVPGEECAPVTNLNGMYMNFDGTEGLYVDWEEPEGVTSVILYVEGEALAEIPYGAHPIFLGFEDQLPAYTFTIGVVAVYPDCESEMVETQIYYDDVNENEIITALFPNPTNGNVTIQAEGMTHITVASVLGQVVYDADVNGDEMIINMGQFNAGMYMVRINTVNGVVVKRVTVMQ